MSRLSDTAAWILSGTLFLVVIAWTNLTGFGLGAQPLTYDDVALPRLVVVLVGIAAAWLVLAVMVAKGNQLLCDATWWILGALAAWAMVSAVFAHNTMVWLGQSERLEGVVTVVLYALLFGAGLQLGRSRRYTRRLAGALVAGSALLAVHGLVQTLNLDRTDYTISGASFYLGSAFASLGNPNFLAGLLVLALPAAAGLALTARTPLERVTWWACGALALGALYATYSQGSWLAGVIELALAAGLWMWWRQAGGERATDGGAGAGGAGAADAAQGAAAKHGSPARALGVVLGIIVLGVVLIVGVTGIATRAGLRLWGAGLQETGSGRLMLVQTTLSAVAARPVTGYGPDSFLSAFRLNRPDRWVEVFGQTNTNANAHSWLLQYATTLGLLGALLLAAAVVSGFWHGRPRPRQDGDHSAVLAAAVWIGLVGFAVQMLLNVAMLASTVPFWILLGAVSASRARRTAVPAAAGAGAVAVAALAVAAALLGSAALLGADRAYLESRLAYNGAATGDPVALSQRAVSLNPLSVKYARGLAQARSAQLLNALEGESLSAEEARMRYDRAKRAFDDVLAKSPNDYAALSWLAGLQAAAGTHLEDPVLIDEARTTAAEAAKLDGTHWSVAMILDGDTSLAAARIAVSEPGLP